jgi:hypothetical protein
MGVFFIYKGEVKWYNIFKVCSFIGRRKNVRSITGTATTDFKPAQRYIYFADTKQGASDCRDRGESTFW